MLDPILSKEMEKYLSELAIAWNQIVEDSIVESEKREKELGKDGYKAKNYAEARDIALKYWGIKKPSKLPRLHEVSNGWYSHNYQAKMLFIRKEK